uniref:Gsp_62 putative toxin n=1 Tax=Gemmula speciosa TaxID=439592 RepID=A0A098LW82_GEMSP
MARLMFVGCLIFIVILLDMAAVCSTCTAEGDPCDESGECCSSGCYKDRCLDIAHCQGNARRDMGRRLFSLLKGKATTR